MHQQKIVCHRLLRFAIISTLLCLHTQGNTGRSNSSSNFNDTNRLLPFYPNESMTILYPKCDEPTSPKYIAQAIFSTALVLLGVIGNLTIILVIQYSQLRKEPGYALVTSLAAADFGVSLFVTSSKVHSYRMNGNFCSDLSFCVFHHVMDGLFPTASITHLLLISINKFCAVISPYKYHTLVTHTRERMVILCVWIYCVTWTCAGLVTWDQDPVFSVNVLSNGIDHLCYNHNALFYVFVAICVFTAPVIIAGTLYAILLFIVMDKMRSTPGVPGVERSTLEALQTSSAQRRFSSTKGAKTLMMVFAGWVVCWMPHFSVILVQYINPDVLIKFHQEHPWLSELLGTIISDILPCINSCINPLIYFKTSSMCRHAFKDSYLKLMKKPRYRAGSKTIASKGRHNAWNGQSLETVVKYAASGGREFVMFVPLRPKF